MQTLYILAGHAALGKSTYAKKLAALKNAVIVSTDSIRLELTGSEEDQSQNAFLFNVMVPKKLREAAQTGRDVIFDAMNLKPKDRKTIMSYLPGLAYECHYFLPSVFRAMLNQAKRERQVPQEIIESQASRFVAPTASEGFVNTILIKYEKE